MRIHPHASRFLTRTPAPFPPSGHVPICRRPLWPSPFLINAARCRLNKEKKLKEKEKEKKKQLLLRSPFLSLSSERYFRRQLRMTEERSGVEKRPPLALLVAQRGDESLWKKGDLIWKFAVFPLASWTAFRKTGNINECKVFLNVLCFSLSNWCMYSD